MMVGNSPADIIISVVIIAKVRHLGWVVVMVVKVGKQVSGRLFSWKGTFNQAP